MLLLKPVSPWFSLFSLFQTVELKSQAQQCPVSASTQMTGIGCYVSCMNDRLVTPGTYTTADEHHDRRLRAVSVHWACGCNAVFLSTCCTKCLDTPALSCCFQLCRTKLKRSKLGNNTFELHSASDDSVLPWLLNRNVTSNAALLELSMLYGGNTCSDFWGFRLLALCVTVKSCSSSSSRGFTVFELSDFWCLKWFRCLQSRSASQKMKSSLCV